MYFAHPLHKHGLSADGDIIRLRLISRSSSSTDRKQELKKILESGTSTRLNSTPKVSNKSGSPIPSPTDNSITTRMVYVNWKVFDKKEKKYVQVKAKKEGGCCKIKFRLD